MVSDSRVPTLQLHAQYREHHTSINYDVICADCATLPVLLGCLAKCLPLPAVASKAGALSFFCLKFGRQDPMSEQDNHQTIHSICLHNKDYSLNRKVLFTSLFNEKK